MLYIVFQIENLNLEQLKSWDYLKAGVSLVVKEPQSCNIRPFDARLMQVQNTQPLVCNSLVRYAVYRWKTRGQFRKRRRDADL